MRLAVAVTALALLGCKTRGEEVKERVDKALTGVSSDEQAIGAVSQTLWGKDTYDYQIKVLPFDGGGHRVDIVATRINSDTLLSSAGAMKDFELRMHAKKIWRLFRSVSERQLRQVSVTIRLSLGGPGSKDVLEFLRFHGDAATASAIPGYDANPFDTKGAYDDLTPDGNRYIQRLTPKLVVDADNSAELVIEPK
jgi:hypothetical protein